MTSILHHSNVEEHNQTSAHCLVLCSCNADQELNCRVPPSPFKVTSFSFTNLIALMMIRKEELWTEMLSMSIIIQCLKSSLFVYNTRRQSCGGGEAGAN
jgi:hypothetical protein